MFYNALPIIFETNISIKVNSFELFVVLGKEVGWTPETQKFRRPEKLYAQNLSDQKTRNSRN